MTSQAVMKRYLTAVSKTEEYANNTTIQNLAIGIANFKKLEKKQQAELNVLIEGAYKKLQAKGFSVKKTPTKTTTTRKTRTTSQGGLKAILAELKKKLGSEKFKEATTGTDIQKDIKIPALKKGKRIVRKKGYTTNQYGTFKNQVGTAYWESRANRFDANQPSQTRKYKLADGGDISSYDNPKNATHILHIDGQNWYLEKIDSTHFYMSNNPKYRGMAHHIGQHKGESYYDEIKQWLRDTKFAKGGKIEVGSIVNLPEIKMKDGRVQYERVVGGEVIGFEDGVYDVLNPKTNRIHRVSENQIEKPSAYSKHRQTASRMRNDEDTYPKGTEFAKGGMSEHGLEVGDKIVMDVEKRVGNMPNTIGVEDYDKEFHLVDLDKGERYAKGGKTSEEYAVSGILSENDKIEIISKHKSFASALVKMNKMWDEGKLDKYLEVRVKPISKSMEYAKGGEIEKPLSYYKYETPKVRIAWKGRIQPLGMFKSAEEAYEVIEKRTNGIPFEREEFSIVTPDKVIHLGKEYKIIMAKGGTTKRIKRRSC
jgi:hypothetical protein